MAALEAVFAGVPVVAADAAGRDNMRAALVMLLVSTLFQHLHSVLVKNYSV